MSKNEKVLPKYVRPSSGDAHLLTANLITSYRAHLYDNETPAETALDDDARENANIYMLCFRQRVRFLPNSIYEAEDGRLLRGLLEVNTKGVITHVPFEAHLLGLREALLRSTGAPSDLEDRRFDFTVSPYPHTYIKARVSGLNFKKEKQLNVDDLSRFFRWHVKEVQDLDIQYVGQSVGKKYPRNARHRLGKQHHQHRINLTNEQVRRGDLDLLGLYLDFEAVLRGPTEERDIPARSPNIVDLVEGSLIYHFKPSENDKDKVRFPQTEPGREARRSLGVNGIVVALSSDASCYRFYSSFRPPSYFSMVCQSFDSSGFARDRFYDFNLDEAPPNPEMGWKQLAFLNQNRDYVQSVELEIMSRFRERYGALPSTKRTNTPPPYADVFGAEVLQHISKVPESIKGSTTQRFFSFADRLFARSAPDSGNHKLADLLIDGVRRSLQPLVDAQKEDAKRLVRGFGNPDRIQTTHVTMEQLDLGVTAVTPQFQEILRYGIKTTIEQGLEISPLELSVMHPLFVTSYYHSLELSEVRKIVDEAAMAMAPHELDSSLHHLATVLRLARGQIDEVHACAPEPAAPIAAKEQRRYSRKRENKPVEELKKQPVEESKFESSVRVPGSRGTSSSFNP